MKYIHKKGLQLQKPSYLNTPNRKIRELLDGKEVELEKENLEEKKLHSHKFQPGDRRFFFISIFG